MNYAVYFRKGRSIFSLFYGLFLAFQICLIKVLNIKLLRLNIFPYDESIT